MNWNKRGFLDVEILISLGFVLLLALAWGATILGWIASKRMFEYAYPLWQVLGLLAFEFIACYFFIARES